MRGPAGYRRDHSLHYPDRSSGEKDPPIDGPFHYTKNYWLTPLRIRDKRFLTDQTVMVLNETMFFPFNITAQ
jgi:hypothetical protein